MQKSKRPDEIGFIYACPNGNLKGKKHNGITLVSLIVTIVVSWAHPIFTLLNK